MQTSVLVVQLRHLARQGTCGATRDRRSAIRRIRVLAAHRHPLYSEAVSRAIRQRPELDLVGQASDAREALRAIGAEQPDVALIDGALEGLTGAQVLNAIGRDGLRTRVVMIAAEPDPELVYAALARGAAGFLTKDADGRELCDAITAVARGTTVLAPELQAGVAGEIRLRAVHERPFLSDREREVLKLVAEGLTAPQIARRIHLSTATVKTHLSHVYEKLGVAERAAAVAAAMRRGLVE
jgi:two-component system, NarL family, nitrate/nitrite response regulator NarL